MSLVVQPNPADGIVSVGLRGEFTRSQLDTQVQTLASQMNANPMDDGAVYLVDFSEADLAMTASEFMGAVDHWFEHLGELEMAAIVFDGDRHKDQAMLFETKSFLLGGRHKAFTIRDSAMGWLKGWKRAAD